MKTSTLVTVLGFAFRLTQASLQSILTARFVNHVIRNPSSSAHDDESSSMTSQEFYDEVNESINRRDPFTCESLFERPEVSKLHLHQLQPLLERAYQNTLCEAGLEYYALLTTQIVAKIVPEKHPEAYHKFLAYTLLEDVPLRVFKAAIQHAHLLSKAQVNSLLGSIISTASAEDSRFREQIVLLAMNLPRNVNLADLYVFRQEMLRRSGDKSVALALASTSIVRAWRSGQSVLLAVQQFHELCVDHLQLRFQAILKQLELTLLAIDFFNSEQEEEEITPLLSQLHQYAKTHIGPVTELQLGIEDLFFYARGDLGAFIEARLHRYRPTPIKRRQILGLLHVADRRNPESDAAIMAFFKNFLFTPERSLPADVSPRIQLYLQATSLMPKMKLDPVCLKNDDFDPIPVKWTLPSPRFLAETKENYRLHFDYFNLPTLFLFHAFGIPVEQSRVAVNQSELPDVKELLDLANFYGQRYCSLKGEYFAYEIKAA